MRSALVFWFTGLSGSGKTTIAKKTVERLSSSKKRIRIFDGDDVRKKINRHLAFSPEHIEENNRIIAGLCRKSRDRYDYIFVPVISPFSRVRAMVKKMIGDNFYLVYLKISLEEVIRRDVKGLYKKTLAGEIENFIGIDKNVPYEVPRNADIVLDTKREDIDACVQKLVRFIRLKEKSKSKGGQNELVK